MGRCTLVDKENIIILKANSCGIPDFRGLIGIWTLQREGSALPEASLSFHRAMPSMTHMALVELERADILKFVISQNIDGLHLRSGIPKDKLSELHGNSFMERCTSSGTECSPENDDELKVDINRLVTTTCNSSALLMKILSKHDMKEMSMVLKDYLRSWSNAQIVYDTIPHPKVLVEVWVKMQLKDKQEPEARDRTIYNLLSSSFSDISNKSLGILTEDVLSYCVQLLYISIGLPLSVEVMRIIIKVVMDRASGR